MNQHELRIGNLLRTTVTHIILDVDIETLTDVLNGSIEPIPLTEEWLLNGGAIKLNNGLFKMGAFRFEISNDYVRVTYQGVFLCNIKYVHNWQNLYHALTGQELTIKTK